MQKIILLLFAGVLLSAGCLTASEPPREAGIALITPADPAPIFGGRQPSARSSAGRYPESRPTTAWDTLSSHRVTQRPHTGCSEAPR